MSVTAKTLVPSQAAPPTPAAVYTVPQNIRTIIDKFTATNTTGGALTISIYLVPGVITNAPAQSLLPVASNQIIDAFSIAANTAKDFTELQNQILMSGDGIFVAAGPGVTIRGSGREVQ
jgi:hypothetical protein